MEVDFFFPASEKNEVSQGKCRWDFHQAKVENGCSAAA